MVVFTISFHERGLDIYRHSGVDVISSEAKRGSNFYLSLQSSFVTKRSQNAVLEMECNGPE